MIIKLTKTRLIWALAVLSLLLVTGCSQNQKTALKNETKSEQNIKSNNQASSLVIPPTESDSIVYKNMQYGFNFTLPVSWKGYSVIIGNWDGNDIESGKITETGPMISIRHPQWTSQNPRQDIPILIFTLAQWNLLQQEKFHIGAAPIGPSELGRNSSYVFALPARYNYAFPTGYQEVEKILNNHPLQAK